MGMCPTEWDSKQLSSCHIAVKSQRNSEPPVLAMIKKKENTNRNKIMSQHSNLQKEILFPYQNDKHNQQKI